MGSCVGSNGWNSDGLKRVEEINAYRNKLLLISANFFSLLLMKIAHNWTMKNQDKAFQSTMYINGAG